MLKSLQALPCFTHISKVTDVKGGYSNQCFQVTTNDHDFFAKKVSSELLTTEVYLSKVLAKEGLAPAIIYHDQQWVISEFIQGDNLTDSHLSLLDKIAISIELMVKFHGLLSHNLSQANVPTASHTATTKKAINSIPPLSIPKHIEQLLIAEISPDLRATFQKISDQLDLLITPASQGFQQVYCHSDINFSNVLLDANQRSWLIDFEYACKAPAEFDIAMLIAINNLPLSLLEQVIFQYQQKAKQQGFNRLNKDLCNRFLLFSYFINGLWYYNKALQAPCSTKETFTNLAKAQWQLYNQLSNTFAFQSTIVPLSKIS
ncbi:phosphotransferase [Colwellia sp. D2M02]|uniref:phosphotransferase n=1 Tax=Colwellia sp. D2M02 TaxID=2841562 RepID=UPI001C088133|nr:phosphotransferase [Colwellia sp. D2M02]MBU2891699.1 phosphotransferase [Colwellia sp. D2M02]